MDYTEFVASIQEAAKEHLSGGNVVFMVILFIVIILAIIGFALFVRKEYYRKRSEIDTFMLEDQHKTDIYIPEMEKLHEKRKQMKKPGLMERLYNKINRE